MISKKAKKYITKIPLILIGNTFYGLALNLFLIKNQIAAGGFSGIAIVLNYLTGLPVGAMVMIMNIPLFIISYKKMGRDFFIGCLLSTFTMSAIIDSMSFLPLFTQDKLMASIYGGVLSGVGMGLLYMVDSSSGGSDLLARLLIKTVFKSISYGKLVFILDGMVVTTAAIVFGSVESALYAAITIYAGSKIADTIISGFDYAKICYIITEHPQHVSDMLMSSLSRGVTLIDGIGMYTKEPRNMLFMVMRRGEAVKVKEIVKSIDPDAFIVVSEAVEVLGLGFKPLEGRKDII